MSIRADLALRKVHDPGSPLRRAAGWGLLAVALAVTSVAPAWAHPFDREFYSMRSAVRLDGGRLEAVVVVEVPTPKIMLAFVRKYGYKSKYTQEEMDTFAREQFDSLAEYLHVEVDGSTAPGSWAPVDDPRNARGGEGFFVLMLEFHPEPSPALPNHVQVSVHNDAYEGEPMYYSGYAEAGAGWSLLHCSAEDLVGDLDSSVDFANDLEAWTDDPALRVVSATFEKSAGNHSEAPENR